VYDAIRDHPERFTEDEVFVSEESRGQGIVKDKYTFPVDIEGRYMENATRITMKKIVDRLLGSVNAEGWGNPSDLE